MLMTIMSSYEETNSETQYNILGYNFDSHFHDEMNTPTEILTTK